MAASTAASAAAKTIVLVTGASGGIGFELAAQLASRGSYHVLLGARSAAKGKAAMEQLQTRRLAESVEVLPLDVTDDATIESAARTVEHKFGRLDMLVNNAGISAMSPPLRQQMRDAFDVNATGPAVIGLAFGPLLQKSTGAPRIVNISSGVGSITRRLDTSSPMYKMQGWQYRASKCALHMVTACLWVEFGPGVKVFAYDPGFTVSNLGPHNNAENGAKSPEEAVMPLIDVLEGKRDHEAGLALHNTGTYEW